MLISLPHLPGASWPQRRSRAAAGLGPGKQVLEAVSLHGTNVARIPPAVPEPHGGCFQLWSPVPHPAGSMAPGTQPARRRPTRLCSSCPRPQSRCKGGPDWWPSPGGLGEKLFALHTPGALSSSRTSQVELLCMSVCSRAPPAPQTWVCPELPPRLRCWGSARDSGGSVNTTEEGRGSWRTRCGTVEAVG